MDAGCGPGAYAEWLADRGAEVVAFAVSEKMVRLARERLGTKASVLQADFDLPLDFLEDESFEFVLSALAMDYVSDWDRVFGECRRVLRQGGRLVFSVEHPCSTFVHRVYRGAGNYFETQIVNTEFTGFGEPVTMPAYRRSLGAMINTLIKASFVLERILEPAPTERFREADPEEYEKLSRMPGLLCLRAVKR